MRTLTLSLLSVVLLATIGLGWMFDNFYNKYAEQSKEQQKDAITVLEQLGSNLAQSLDGLGNRSLFIKKWQANGQYQINIVPLKHLPLPEKLLKSTKSGKPLILETDDSIAIHYYLASSNEFLILSAPPIIIAETGSMVNFLFTALFYLAMLLLVFLWLYPLAKRLLVLRKVAKAFGEGELEQRVEVGSISYIKDLEIEFNHMAQRIEALVSDVKLLSSAVSHDLRTPLARIRFGIDTLQEEDDPILRKRFEQRISDNVSEMVDLVETLLNYARLDQAMLELNKTKVNLAVLIANAIKNKSDDNIYINYSIKDDEAEPWVHGDSAYLMILVANLIQNACQYCHSRIDINITDNHKYIILTVSDDGKGIPAEQREQILKPFIRGKDKDQNIKGFGMGLAIVKRILEWHQGEIKIAQSAKLSGAEFTVFIPKYQNIKT
jgi:two-component system OmpR family sensor kinase